MSRVGIKHLIEARLRYIPVGSYTQVTHLITAKCRGYAYVKNLTAYQEFHDGRIVTITPDIVIIAFVGWYINYNSDSIIVGYPRINRKYIWKNRVFTIYEGENLIVQLVTTEGIWPKLPDDRWTCMQKMVRWFPAY